MCNNIEYELHVLRLKWTMDLKSSVYADMFVFTRFKHIKHQHLPAITVYWENWFRENATSFTELAVYYKRWGSPVIHCPIPCPIPWPNTVACHNQMMARVCVSSFQLVPVCLLPEAQTGQRWENVTGDGQTSRVVWQLPVEFSAVICDRVL